MASSKNSPIARRGAAKSRAVPQYEATTQRRFPVDFARVQRIGEVGAIDIDVLDGLTSWRSPEYLRLHGLPEDGRQETHAQWLQRLHPEDRDRADATLAAALGGTGLTYDNEYRIVRPSDGQVRWIHARADIERNSDGAAVRLIGVHTDITARKGMEQALDESAAWTVAQKEAFQAAMDGESLAASLGILIDAAMRRAKDGRRFAFYMADAQSGTLSHVVGMPESYARKVDGFAISPDSLACGLAVAIGAPVITRDVHEEPRWKDWTWLADEYGYRGCWSFPVETAAGQVVGSFTFYFAEPREAQPEDHALAASITPAAAIIISHHQQAEERRRIEAALRQSEARLQTLVGELQHRVRNILSVVRSVFRRTADATGDPEELASHFIGRLDALARTEVIVTRSAAGDVDLEALIRDELLSVGASDGPALSIAGPVVALPSKVAESLGLALHELTTNSLKYGALRHAGSHLRVSWKSNLHYGEGRRLTIIWQEQGVPAVPVEPVRQGFGRELIGDALPYRLGAETKLEFLGGGIRCSISLPLPDQG